jgi:hypothetical protein
MGENDRKESSKKTTNEMNRKCGAIHSIEALASNNKWIGNVDPSTQLKPSRATIIGYQQRALTRMMTRMITRSRK